jgi:hypothetical protein
VEVVEEEIGYFVELELGIFIEVEFVKHIDN